TYFKERNKVFEMNEIDVQNTEEDHFKNNYSMLTYSQLHVAIDSLERRIDNRYISMANHLKRHFQPTKDKVEKAISSPYEIAREKARKKKQELKKAENKAKKEKAMLEKNKAKKEAKKKDLDKKKKPPVPKKKPVKTKKKKKSPTTKKKKSTSKTSSKSKEKNNKKKSEADKAKKKNTPIQMKLDKPITEYKSFLETLSPDKRERLINKTKSFARGIRDQAEGAISSLSYTKEVRVKHVYEMNMKFSMAFVCIIFLFIGGPMGAIIRKGGFGYPILVAIIFFILFMVMNIFFKKLAESLVLVPELASWMPCILLIPMAALLTHRAMNDMSMVNVERYKRIFLAIKNFFSKKKKKVQTS
ncbi:MAG: LptF/LptG family permease, partial [Saprospiraceae bacterium]